MNPLKTVKSFEKFMAANVEKSESEIVNLLYLHAKCNVSFRDVADLVGTYRALYKGN